MYAAAVIYFLFHFEVGMLLKTLLKSFKDSVLVPYFTKMPVYGPHIRKLMHVKWQLLPGKVQDAFRYHFGVSCAKINCFTMIAFFLLIYLSLQNIVAHVYFLQKYIHLVINCFIGIIFRRQEKDFA